MGTPLSRLLQAIALAGTPVDFSIAYSQYSTFSSWHTLAAVSFSAFSGEVSQMSEKNVEPLLRVDQKKQKQILRCGDCLWSFSDKGQDQNVS
jgi:hypothetical protein